MRTRKLGGSNLELTTIGLGTWAIGGPWEFGWGPQSDADSVSAIRAAIDAGVNWIDTAPIYGCGHAEEVVGTALKGLGEKPIIATKCGLAWDGQRRKVNRLDREAIVAEAEASLRRLGVDVIDLWQIHWPVPDEQLEEAWEAMAAVRDQGKVRYLGASNFTIRQIERVAKISPAVSLQPPYSMINRAAEDELFGYCEEHSMGIVCYSPMHRGLLSGRFSVERFKNLAADDHRRNVPAFKEPALSTNLALVEKLKPIAQRNDRTVAQLAIAWTLFHDEVTAAIVGARNPRQIEETAQAGDWILDQSEMEEIANLLG